MTYTPPCRNRSSVYDLTIDASSRTIREAAEDEAKEICSGCYVRDECLAENFNLEGVIAGLTLTERMALNDPAAPKARPSCGTLGGANIHARHGEPVCMTCRRAMHRLGALQVPPHQPRPPCGVEQGYQWHWRNGEDACGPCLEAHRAASKANRRKRGAA